MTLSARLAGSTGTYFGAGEGAESGPFLFIAHSESPFVTEMVEAEVDSGRFVQSVPAGPHTMSKADARLATPGEE